MSTTLAPQRFGLKDKWLLADVCGTGIGFANFPAWLFQNVDGRPSGRSAHCPAVGLSKSWPNPESSANRKQIPQLSPVHSGMQHTPSTKECAILTHL